MYVVKIYSFVQQQIFIWLVGVSTTLIQIDDLDHFWTEWSKFCIYKKFSCWVWWSFLLSISCRLTLLVKCEISEQLFLMDWQEVWHRCSCSLVVIPSFSSGVIKKCLWGGFAAKHTTVHIHGSNLSLWSKYYLSFLSVSPCFYLTVAVCSIKLH